MPYQIPAQPEIAEKIIAQIANTTDSLRSMFSEPDMPDRSTFYRWLLDDPKLHNGYVNAQIIRAGILAEDLQQVVDDTDNIMTQKAGKLSPMEYARLAKIKADNIKFLMRNTNTLRLVHYYEPAPPPKSAEEKWQESLADARVRHEEKKWALIEAQNAKIADEPPFPDGRGLHPSPFLIQKWTRKPKLPNVTATQEAASRTAEVVAQNVTARNEAASRTTEVVAQDVTATQEAASRTAEVVAQNVTARNEAASRTAEVVAQNLAAPNEAASQTEEVVAQNPEAPDKLEDIPADALAMMNEIFANVAALEQEDANQNQPSPGQKTSKVVAQTTKTPYIPTHRSEWEEPHDENPQKIPMYIIKAALKQDPFYNPASPKWSHGHEVATRLLQERPSVHTSYVPTHRSEWEEPYEENPLKMPLYIIKAAREEDPFYDPASAKWSFGHEVAMRLIQEAASAHTPPPPNDE